MCSTVSFDTAAMSVISAIEQGYHPNRDNTPLESSDWARLTCGLLAAVGRGYQVHYTAEKAATLSKIRADSTDPEPLAPLLPNLLSSARGHSWKYHLRDPARPRGLPGLVCPDKRKVQREGYQAAAEVDEKWLN